MVIGAKVLFLIFPPGALRKGSNMLMSTGMVRTERDNFPILDVGSTYVLEVPPYTFDNCKEQFDSAMVDVHSIEYHEANGGVFQITCIANPRGYAGLCLAYGETKF